jgi:hypothetical protein
MATNRIIVNDDDVIFRHNFFCVDRHHFFRYYCNVPTSANDKVSTLA